MNSGTRRSAGWSKWPFILALLLCLAAGWPLLASPGLIETRAGGDSPFLLLRTQQLVSALRDGNFPVRWMGDAAYGMGYPFFNFYASLPYYLAALLKFLGFTYVNAIKFTQLAGLLAAGLGAYLFSQRIWRNRWGALLASAAYTLAPFHLVNLYVRGDSLSEFYAFAFYPFILLTLDGLWEKPTLPRVGAVALAFGGLVMTHNVSAILFLPFVGLFLVYLLVRTSQARGRRLLAACAALALGLALSAWFWLPALLETDLVHLEAQTTGYFFYGEHFRAQNLVQTTPLFQYQMDESGTPFGMGLIQALLTVLAALWVLYRWVRKRQVDKDELWLLVILGVATWLITPWSRLAWERVPLLPFAQFPWRFLSVQALAAALLIGRLAEIPRGRRCVAEGLVLVLALAVLLSIQPTYLYVSDTDITPERLILYEAFTGNIGSTVRAEYLPRWTEPRPYAGERLWTEAEPGPRVLAGEVSTAALVRKESDSQRWQIAVVSSEARLVFPTLYYPGWRAYVDGREVGCEPQAGWGAITLTLPKGDHEVALRFAHTGLRLAAELVSLLALIGCCALVLAGKPPLRRAAKAVGWTGAVLAVTLLVACGSTALSPSYPADDLTMDWAKGPYLAHNPGGLRYEGGARLLRYALPADGAAPGDFLDVTLYWDAPAAGLSAQLTLEGMNAPLFGVPNVLSVSESPVRAGQSAHRLEIPATLPQGAYVLGVRLLQDGGELRPLDENNHPQGRTYLAPLKVTASARLPDDALLDEHFGESVRLRRVEAEQSQPGQLAVALTWTTEAQLPQNYAVSVRLLGADGSVIAQHDSQPNYGFSPTALWLPDVPVQDRHWLDLPPGLTPDQGYALEVVLYDPLTLAAIGTVSIPDVYLTLLDVRESYPVLATFGSEIGLSALALDTAEAWQGETVTIHATWAALKSTTQTYTVHLALQTAAGATVWENRVPLLDRELPQNALVARQYALDVPLHLAHGAYSLAVAVEDDTGTPLSTYTLDAALTVRERERTFSIPEMAHRADVVFGEEIALLGYDLHQEGTSLRLVLHWQAQVRPTADWTVFVHLFDPETEAIPSQYDGQPRGGAYPTSQWAAGEVVSDEVVLSLEGVPAGVYRLAIGLYGPGEVGRLQARLEDGTRLPDDRYIPPDEITVR